MIIAIFKKIETAVLILLTYSLNELAKKEIQLSWQMVQDVARMMTGSLLCCFSLKVFSRSK